MTHSEQSRVIDALTGVVGTVVALDGDLIMVMPDTIDGQENAGGRAFWYPSQRFTAQVPVRFHVTFTSADDGVSTCDVPCAIDGDPVDVVAQVDGVYGHLAQRTPHGGVFYTISGVSDLLPPSGALVVHVDAYGTVRVV